MEAHQFKVGYRYAFVHLTAFVQLHAEHQKHMLAQSKLHGARTSRRDHGMNWTNQKKAGFPARELVFCKGMKLLEACCVTVTSC